MVMSDPIADMLTRIRNANSAYHEKVEMPASTMKAAVLDILKEEGFVKNYESVNEGKTLKVTLKYGSNKEKVITKTRFQGSAFYFGKVHFAPSKNRKYLV